MTTDTTLKIRIENAEGHVVVHAEGAMCVASAGSLAHLQEVLRTAWHEQRRTLLDLSGISDLDLCGMQLLCSAHHSFFQRGLILDLHGAPVWFAERSRAAGFDASKAVCCSQNGAECIWKC
jgi:anti-anti-sigma regulatory factor